MWKPASVPGYSQDRRHAEPNPCLLYFEDLAALLGGASLRHPLIALLSLRTRERISSVATGNCATYVGCSTRRWTDVASSCFSGARQVWARQPSPRRCVEKLQIGAHSRLWAAATT